MADEKINMFSSPESAAYFLRQSRRAKKIMLDVLAGVIWSEMTLMYRKDKHYTEVDSEEEDVEMEQFSLMGSKDIIGYIYKALDSGIPPLPTYARFKAGLVIHGVPLNCLGLYEQFIEDYTTIEFGKLYEKLVRGYVDSDTGNYCSYHGPHTIGKPRNMGVGMGIAPKLSPVYESEGENSEDEGEDQEEEGVDQENKENDQTLALAVAAALK